MQQDRSLSGDSLTLVRVRNDFGIFHGYDLGGPPPPIDVTTERETEKGFEIRTHDAVPKALLSHCGFRNPLSDNSTNFVWNEFEKMAQCVIREPGARTSYRSFDEPSFVERGGK
jgi:hypothetical protein